MNVLVTGGAGFIGSNVVDRLLTEGYNVSVIDNEFSDVHEQFYWNNKCNNYKLDICDYNSTRELYNNIDVVFHLAAEARIQPAIENPLKACEINMLGTATVLQCSREAGVSRVVYSSTSSAYGGNKTPNTETQPDDCLNPYAVSKVAGEKLCKMYTDLFELNTVIFRYFNVYGERQPLKGQYAPVVGIFMRQRSNDEPLTIVGDGEQRRDFTYVGDVAEANFLAGTTDLQPEEFGEVYNIGTGTNNSIKEIADMISDKQKHIPPRNGESKITLANISKFVKATGWNPRTSVNVWIKENL